MIALLVSVFFPAFALLADVIITKDDMILNGKILEDKEPEYIRFANYHGNFKIKYKQIKEIYRTESFEDDIEFYKEIGRPVNEEEIQKNYLSGLKMSEDYNKKNKLKAGGVESFILMMNVFYGRNSGRLDSVLPYSGGVSVSAVFPVSENAAEAFNISGILAEADYFYSEKDERSINGFSGAAGPVWRIPAVVFNYNFYYNISAAAGAGWYSVKNGSEKASGAKWHLVFHTGPVFDIYSVIISPEIRLEYINDGAAPLYFAGLSLGAGYKF
jgi:hypothetical protein